LYAERLSPDQVRAAQEFVAGVIFKPWAKGGEGPDAYWCYGLAKVTERTLAGRELPLINCEPADVRTAVRLVRDHAVTDEWLNVPSPRHLDVVTLSRAHLSHHIGVWLSLDGGMLLHALEQFDRNGKPAPKKPGVLLGSMAQLRMGGWRSFEFYRHRDAMGAAP
jgi:hypothetical protein